MAKRVARMAMWTALAMVFSYVEAIIPFSFGVQGSQAWACQYCCSCRIVYDAG